MDPAIIAGGLNALGSLFGKKSGRTPGQNIISQARGAREAAEAFGFNPLTMLQYGQSGGSMSEGGTGLSSGAYIAEAVSRGFDTYFNYKSEQKEQEAEAVASARDHMENVYQSRANDPLARFGYNLTDQAPFGIPVTNYGGRGFGTGDNNIEGAGGRVLGDDTGRLYGTGPFNLTVGANTPAQKVEDQYGDGVGAGVGYGNYMSDLGEAAGRKLDKYVNPALVKIGNSKFAKNAFKGMSAAAWKEWAAKVNYPAEKYKAGADKFWSYVLDRPKKRKPAWHYNGPSYVDQPYW